MSLDINRAARQADATHGHKDNRQQDASNRIGVVNGIKRQVAFILYSVVPAPIRHDRMTEFMDAHREDPQHSNNNEAFHYCVVRLSGYGIASRFVSDAVFSAAASRSGPLDRCIWLRCQTIQTIRAREGRAG